MTTKDKTFLNSLHKAFPFTPTMEQENLLKKLVNFTLFSERFELFLLKGYAGTGKTTVVSTLVNTLSQVGYKSVLLAPTGRVTELDAVGFKWDASDTASW